MNYVGKFVAALGIASLAACGSQASQNNAPKSDAEYREKLSEERNQRRKIERCSAELIGNFENYAHQVREANPKIKYTQDIADEGTVVSFPETEYGEAKHPKLKMRIISSEEADMITKARSYNTSRGSECFQLNAEEMDKVNTFFRSHVWHSKN